MEEPDKKFSAALSIVRILRALGHDAVFAGGSVRDRLLGRQPKDYDIATSARPEQVMGAFEHSQDVGAAFGVILVVLQGSAYEVATFRADGPYEDGRHPQSVSFASPEVDAQRRDFTVNGMFFDPDRNEVQDYVGGQRDLEARLIRAIGDPAKRFEEDRLRLLRAVRFAVQLGFEIEAQTWEALKQWAPQILTVAMERVQSELTKILTSPDPRRGVELLDQSGLLEILLPEIVPLKGCTQPPQFHPEGDVWIHTLLALGALKDASPALAWATLLHDIGKPKTRTEEPGDRIRFHEHESVGAEMSLGILKRLKLSGELSEAIRILVADHLRLSPIKEMKLSTLKRLLRREDFQELLELHRVDCIASHGNLELYEFAKSKYEEFMAASQEASLRPESLLDGADLISLGYQPGPLFKEILGALEDEQLEGRISEKSKALDFVQTHYPVT